MSWPRISIDSPLLWLLCLIWPLECRESCEECYDDAG